MNIYFDLIITNPISGNDNGPKKDSTGTIACKAVSSSSSSSCSSSSSKTKSDSSSQLSLKVNKIGYVPKPPHCQHGKLYQVNL